MTDAEIELRRNLHTGQMDRMQRMQTAVLAQALGLDPGEFAKPFPGNQSITINHAPPPVPAPVVATKSPIPRRGLSTAAAVGIGLLAALVPGAGILGYLAAKPATAVIEKVIQQPGRDTVRDYDFDVDMRVIPPPSAPAPEGAD